ncbi:sll0787 family AIR synthase-like protein [Flavobacterium soyangense]|uniref:Sll0787 family AIR synthase-like protein n=1 Tax=Flavobacterium soyangense TaxID=2023265 RepID=A0A930UCJ0_9FLAO|nr:sll0787 family AIR synthase-like protein [Flavobacterium soyangense]MBF2709687.1 sll0787 family AIR synthase-like protein [Flavobacterium soyangense]
MTVAINDIVASIESLRNHVDIIDKRTIEQTYKNIGNATKSSVYFPDDAATILLGDDAAAIPQKDGSHLLLAAEGIVSHFLKSDPWFAGYSAVMVNISDICAMGGLPIAVTDTIYSFKAEDNEAIWDGMIAASQAYGVPIVGGHSCYHSAINALSVSILGKATSNILTSFDAQPGDAILLAIDLNGNYYKEYPFWNASTTNSSQNLQKLAQLPYKIANNKWSKVAKDVSMGGIIGTLLMLLNTSKVGAEINIEAITKPESTTWKKWLSSFPSYGYLFSCPTKNIQNIKSLFAENGINCDHIGSISKQPDLFLNYKEHKLKF